MDDRIEEVIHSFTDHFTTRDYFSVDLMEDCFQILALARLLAIEEAEELSETTLRLEQSEG